jgi:hypothetical protein
MRCSVVTRTAALVVVLTSVAACDAIQTPTDSLAFSYAAVTSSAQSASSGYTVDDEWERVAREEIPGFAGYYDDGMGIVANVVNASQAEAARGYVLRSRRSAPLPATPVRTRVVRYDYVALGSWKRSMQRHLGDVLTSLDIDESRNSIRLGIANPSDTLAATTIALTEGIPRDAFTIGVDDKIVFRATLSDDLRPVRGGQTVFAEQRLRQCSLGFNAEQNGIRVLVTASHCSAQTHQLDGKKLMQAARWIGWEIKDAVPPPTRKPQADATLYQYFDSVPSGKGLIARTTSVGLYAPGSRTINDADPVFEVGWKAIPAVMDLNRWLDKVGSESGWTRGQITATCMDITIEGKAYSCQYRTSVYVVDGDSGSPIFYATPNPSETPSQLVVGLYGIVIAGSATNPNISYFSPITGIEFELGTLAVCNPLNQC